MTLSVPTNPTDGSLTLTVPNFETDPLEPQHLIEPDPTNPDPQPYFPPVAPSDPDLHGWAGFFTCRLLPTTSGDCDYVCTLTMCALGNCENEISQSVANPNGCCSASFHFYTSEDGLSYGGPY